MLKINNLHAQINNKQILNGINLEIKPGEIHAIMGPNGSGKTTLANILAKNPNFAVTDGQIIFNNKNLNDLSPDQCAHLGIFLSFQYPVALPGVTNIQFLKTILNNKLKSSNLPPIDAIDFLNIIRAKMDLLNIPEELLYRAVNDGFSGGEKKCNEILQMALLDPKLVILDEIDSGLDIDALKSVANGINQQHKNNPESSFLIITHYQRLLNYINPDFIHIMQQGQIIKSGDFNLVKVLETEGYGGI